MGFKVWEQKPQQTRPIEEVDTRRHKGLLGSQVWSLMDRGRAGESKRKQEWQFMLEISSDPTSQRLVIVWVIGHVTYVT